MSLKELTPVILAQIVVIFGIWLSAQLAISKFHKEKTWDRREAAYKSILNSLSVMKEFYERYYAHITSKREMDRLEQSKIHDAYREALNELNRKIDTESWLLSDRSTITLHSFQKEISKTYEDWMDDIEEGLKATDKAIKRISSYARDELRTHSR